jgi:hypothetical protein
MQHKGDKTMTKEELTTKWVGKEVQDNTVYAYQPDTRIFLIELDLKIAQGKFLSDLNEVIRGELIKYEMWLHPNSGNKFASRQVNEYLKSQQT